MSVSVCRVTYGVLRRLHAADAEDEDDQRVCERVAEGRPGGGDAQRAEECAGSRSAEREPPPAASSADHDRAGSGLSHAGSLPKNGIASPLFQW